MAKTVKCAFCGKEMVSGFFKGEGLSVDMAGTYITCCEDCYKHFELDNSIENKRFSAKLANYKKTNKIKKLSEQEVVALFNTYFTEMLSYRSRNAQAGELKSMGYFYGNDNGYFCTTEFALGSVTTAKDMAKAIDKWETPAVGAFDRNDISRMEYRLVDKLGTDTGKAFTTAYLFEVYLNDPREMHYRPCVVYYLTTGTAFLPHKRLKHAEASMTAILRTLKQVTGTSARIVRVK